MISFNDIVLTLGQNAILKKLTGHFESGAISALVGPNGSGKSSLLSILSGIRSPTSGECHLDGIPYKNYSQAKLAQKLAFLPQRNPVPNSLTVSDLVAFGRHPHRPWYRSMQPEDKEKIDWAMHETGVIHYKNRPLTALSGGELQRCWLAMTLAQDTPILLLDEPTSWLDIAHQQSLLNIVKRLNEAHHKTIIWVLHDLNQARRFSHFGMLLNEGNIVASGNIEQVITPALVSDVYQTKVRALPFDGIPMLLPEYV